MKPKLTKITNNKNIYNLNNEQSEINSKRLVSAKNNTRSFSNNRPFTSKINKHFNKKLSCIFIIFFKFLNKNLYLD